MTSSLTTPLRQIVAMGGGGFSMEPRNQRLDRYILSLSTKPRPRIALLSTASGDSFEYVDRFYRTMRRLPCEPTHLFLFRIDPKLPSPAVRLLEQDIIYVGGGSTANMLAVWRLHGIDRTLREAWRRGIILCGLSAGMICWFEASLTDSFGPPRALNDGLNFLPGSACPHFDGETHRRPHFHRLIAEKTLPDGIAADDGAAVHFIGRKIFRCVSSRRHAKAYRVVRKNSIVTETQIPTTFLGLKGDLPA